MAQIKPESVSKKFQRKVMFGFFILLLAGCTDTEYKNVEIDYNSGYVSVLGENNFVIDSIYIFKSNQILYSLGLVNKQGGTNKILLSEQALRDYMIYINLLDSITCHELDLELGLVLRRKGSEIKVTPEIASNIKHKKDIQVLRGVKYDKCFEHIDTIHTEQRYR